MKRVLITGATGFVGKTVLKRLDARKDVAVVAAVRSAKKLPEDFDGEVKEGDLTDRSYRSDIVRNIDAVVHAASWASMWRNGNNERIKFYEPTVALVEEAVGAGVQRFVLTGTITMNRKTVPGERIKDDDSTADTGFWPHLDYLNAVDRYMRENADRGTGMVTLRLGHFIGVGNRLGLVPALVPRLKTRLVPHLAGGTRRMPLITPEDIAESYERSLFGNDLEPYETFNIVGREFPTLREVIVHITERTGIPEPFFSVPYPVAYAFGFLTEILHPPFPGYPFLTRSIVHLTEGWEASNAKAEAKLGYRPIGDWRKALDDQLEEIERAGYPWPALKTAG